MGHSSRAPSGRGGNVSRCQETRTELLGGTGGYFIDNRFRRLLHQPEKILAAYLQPGMTAMDFGCGMGFFSIPMAKLVEASGTVIAVDLQSQMLRTLRKRAEKAGVATEFAHINVSEIPLASIIRLISCWPSGPHMKPRTFAGFWSRSMPAWSMAER